MATQTVRHRQGSGNTASRGTGGSQGHGQAQTSGGSAGVSGEGLAKALGWFSIGLGLVQLLMPEQLAKWIGVKSTPSTRMLLQGIGIRELAAGIPILASRRPVRPIDARIAGDLMDLSLLGTALSSDDNEQERVTAATLAVLGVAVLDVICSVQLHRGSSQASGGIHVEENITINRPPEEIYQFWRNFENLPRFMHHLESVQVQGDGRSHWKAKAPAGMTVEWDAEIVDDVPNALIAWRSVDNADVKNSGIVRFVPAPGNRGTEVRVSLEYEPPAGRLGAAVAKLFGEEPEVQIYDDLRAFKQFLETGEIVRSDATEQSKRYMQLPAQPRRGKSGQ